VILIHQRHIKTDRQTDGRTTSNLNAALYISAVKQILKTPTRYDTGNIGIADIIDDTDSIELSLVSCTYFYRAMLAQSAVMRLLSSVRLSVCP